MRAFTALLATAALCGAGCQDQGPEAPPGATDESGDRMLVREATVAMEVERCADALEELAAIASRAEGSLTRSDRGEQPGGAAMAEAVVRVPATSLDGTLARIRELAVEVESQSTSEVDVTEEHIDREARLGAKRQLEQRYLALLERADQVSEMLQIEAALGEVRSDIETLEAQSRDLAGRVAMATITVRMHEPESLLARLSASAELGASASGWLLAALVTVSTALGPYVITVVLLALGLGSLMRRRRAARPA